MGKVWFYGMTQELLQRIDLHTHSTCSDGTLHPSELVEYAYQKGLKAIALTDHDTVDGISEAMEHAERMKQRFLAKGLKEAASRVPYVIPGIELSTEYMGSDVHIVGLSIDPDRDSFRRYLEDFITSRENRNLRMCTLLQEHGIPIRYEALLAEYPDSVITRAHFAKYMLNHGYISSMQEAFARYVGDHCPCYVPREKVTPEQAVSLILEADGIPVLAHPILYHMSDANLDRLVASLKKSGLIGIEAIYSTYSTAEERNIRRIADKYRLLLSGGSDFHGENKPGLDLGTGYGKLFVPSSLLDELQKARKNALFTDMDGTLLRNDSTISPELRDELRRMTASGHRLILSSGRPLPAITQVLETAGLTDCGNTYIISNNGALIYDWSHHTPLQKLLLAPDTIREIIALADCDGLHIHGYTDTEIVCRRPNEELAFYRRRIHMPLLCVEDIATALPQGCCKLQCISLNNHPALEAFREKLQQIYGDRIRVFFSNANYLEILPAGADKGRALCFLADSFPMPLSHTYAAGDEENDIPMLEAAGTGIAMQNAAPAAKRVATVITEKTNDEDGLLPFVRDLFR